MVEMVKAYLVYLGQLDSPLNVTIAVKIYWDKAYGSQSYDILTVRADDVVVVNSKYLQSTPAELSGEVAQFQMNSLKLLQAINFRADIIEDDWWIFGGDKDAGAGTATFKVSELRDERHVKLRPTNGSSFRTNSA